MVSNVNDKEIFRQRISVSGKVHDEIKLSLPTASLTCRTKECYTCSPAHILVEVQISASSKEAKYDKQLSFIIAGCCSSGNSLITCRKLVSIDLQVPPGALIRTSTSCLSG